MKKAQKKTMKPKFSTDTSARPAQNTSSSVSHLNRWWASCRALQGWHRVWCLNTRPLWRAGGARHHSDVVGTVTYPKCSTIQSLSCVCYTFPSSFFISSFFFKNEKDLAQSYLHQENNEIRTQLDTARHAAAEARAPSSGPTRGPKGATRGPAAEPRRCRWPEWGCRSSRRR